MAYTKTLWKTGDVVTQEKMNKIEQGIKSMELPTVTTNDNGKSLVVENGTWALGNASDSTVNGGGVFTIPITLEYQGTAQSGAPLYSATTNIKWSEFRDALNSGADVRCLATTGNDSILNLNSILKLSQVQRSNTNDGFDDCTFVFNAFDFYSNGPTINNIMAYRVTLSKDTQNEDSIFVSYTTAIRTFSS